MTFYFPTTRARGFAGSPIWRCKGEYWPTGRRRVPVEKASELWIRGLTMRQIVNEIGPIKGTLLTVGALCMAIDRERRFGNPALFPIRRSADDGEFDPGIDERMQQALGI